MAVLRCPSRSAASAPCPSRSCTVTSAGVRAWARCRCSGVLPSIATSRAGMARMPEDQGGVQIAAVSDDCPVTEQSMHGVPKPLPLADGFPVRQDLCPTCERQGQRRVTVPRRGVHGGFLAQQQVHRPVPACRPSRSPCPAAICMFGWLTA